MTKSQNDILDYVIAVVGAFAQRFSITNGQAYRYLSNYKALDFVIKNYEIEHTFSIDDAVDDCTAICLRHGGALVL